MSLSVADLLRERNPQWSLAHELQFLGHEQVHLQVLGEKRLARWVSLSEALELQPVLEGMGRPVYLTLNPSRPAGRAPYVWGPNWLRNADFTHYVVVPFDVDPIRTNGIKECPTTLIELKSGALAALRTLEWLQRAGCPPEAIGLMCSGNGYWVLLRCRIPADPNGEALVRGFLGRWKAALETPDVVLDDGNFDPRRVGPFLGITKRKGEESADRRYRKSYWVAGDGSIELSALDVLKLLRRLGGEPGPVRVKRSGTYHPDVLEEALQKLGATRVFAALGLSSSHCLWCGHTAQGNSTTVMILETQGGRCRAACAVRAGAWVATHAALCVSSACTSPVKTTGVAMSAKSVRGSRASSE